MKTELHFIHIKEQLIRALQQAQSTIYVAVAWLTDEDLIRIMTQKRQENIYVVLLISNSIENFKRLDKFKAYLAAGGEFYVAQEAFLHHKFCLIDDHLFINGSYNWSYSAQYNEENITVMDLDDTAEDQRLIRQIQVKLNYLKFKLSARVNNYTELLQYATLSIDNGEKLIIIDETEMALRRAFEDHVKRSVEIAKKEKIPSDYDRLLGRMKADGGGVYFVKRILREEMAKNEMKSGFDKLVRLIPHRVDLSLEYLASRPQYASLFTKEETEFCVNLMQKYHLA
jgi:phosphatidylserine/phosphatidylglycerophosphate/cardiolipin synthase-like enzyme